MIKLREYKKTDFAALVQLQNELQDYFVAQDPFGILRRQPNYGRKYTHYCLREVRKHKGKIFVAMDGKSMVGFIIGAVYTKGPLELTFYKPIKTGFVFMLYVQPAYQKKRVGTKLMNAMETYFKAAGCHIARLDAVGSHTKPYGYYRSRDYQAWGVDMVKVLRKV